MPSLNLNAISKTVEKYMLDTILIQRRADTVMDPETLRETEDRDDVWTGKCFCGPQGQPVLMVVGGRTVSRTLYEFGLPLTDVDGVLPEVNANDIITFVTSRDPELLGEEFIVDGNIPTTFLVDRRIIARMDRTASE